MPTSRPRWRPWRWGASTVFEKPIDDNAFLNALERRATDPQASTLPRHPRGDRQAQRSRAVHARADATGTLQQGYCPQTVEERQGNRAASPERGAQAGLHFRHGSVAEGPGLPAAEPQPTRLHQGGLSDRPVYQCEIADLVATIRRRPAHA